MPVCESRYFGTLEWESGTEFAFPCGLPGYEQEKAFIAVQPPRLRPIVFLQSTRDSGPCFPTLPVRTVDSGYELAISPEDLRVLGLPEYPEPEPSPGILCLAIVSLPEGEPPSANLLAPVVINLKTRVGVQAVRGDMRYSCRQPLALCEVASCS